MELVYRKIHAALCIYSTTTDRYGNTIHACVLARASERASAYVHNAYTLFIALLIGRDVISRGQSCDRPFLCTVKA